MVRDNDQGMTVLPSGNILLEAGGSAECVCGMGIALSHAPSPWLHIVDTNKRSARVIILPATTKIAKWRNVWV